MIQNEIKKIRKRISYVHIHRICFFLLLRVSFYFKKIGFTFYYIIIFIIWWGKIFFEENNSGIGQVYINCLNRMLTITYHPCIRQTVRESFVSE